MLPTKLMTATATPIRAFSAAAQTESPPRKRASQTPCGTKTMTKPEIRKPATTSFQIIDHSLRYWFPSRYQPLQEKTTSRQPPRPARSCSKDSRQPGEQNLRVRPSTSSV